MADTAHISLVAVLPVLAAGFAVPQFLPQILKLRRTHDIAGLSTPWALLTGINNTAWFAYFVASHYWFALIPSSSAAVLSGSLGIMLMRHRCGPPASGVLIGAWTLMLVVAGAFDRRLLGVMLTGAFLVQVVPAVTTAYRTRHPTGIARGTWRLILAEVSCWAAFGAANHDGPLIVLGTTGIASALLMLHRARSRNAPAMTSTSSSRTVPGEPVEGTMGVPAQPHDDGHGRATRVAAPLNHSAAVPPTSAR